MNKFISWILILWAQYFDTDQVRTFIIRLFSLSNPIKEFEGLWKQDPLILSKGIFVEPLKEVLKQIMPEPNELDIRAKVSDIQVDAADIKSGIQVFESDLGKISVTNSYRRRAHA